MWQKIKAVIPKETLINLLICISGVLLIILAGIVPNSLTSANLDQKISSVQFQLEEQKTLYPIYQSLKAKFQKKISTVLPFPVGDKLSREKIESIPATFRDIAGGADMNIVSIVPDLNSPGTDRKFLLVDIALAGEFFDFRKFLIGLEALPYLEHIEELHVRQNQDVMEFKMKIWLALA